jgi:hypothetical protein
VIRIYITYDVKATHLHAAALSLCWYHSSPLSVPSPSLLLYSLSLLISPLQRQGAGYRPAPYVLTTADEEEEEEEDTRAHATMFCGVLNSAWISFGLSS